METVLINLYLSWCNDYLTVETMALDYGVTEPDMLQLIDISRRAYGSMFGNDHGDN